MSQLSCCHQMSISCDRFPDRIWHLKPKFVRWRNQKTDFCSSLVLSYHFIMAKNRILTTLRSVCLLGLSRLGPGGEQMAPLQLSRVLKPLVVDPNEHWKSSECLEENLCSTVRLSSPLQGQMFYVRTNSPCAIVFVPARWRSCPGSLVSGPACSCRTPREWSSRCHGKLPDP